MNSMKSASSDILVDTNVLVYALDPRDRRKQDQAREILAKLVPNKRAVLSVQSLNEFFRSVRWRLQEPLSPAVALSEVARLSITYDILNLTPRIALTGCLASNQFQMSIWDALIWASAKLNEVPIILTEDAEHNRNLEGVTYLNPFHPDFDPVVLDAA